MAAILTMGEWQGVARELPHAHGFSTFHKQIPPLALSPHFFRCRHVSSWGASIEFLLRYLLAGSCSMWIPGPRLSWHLDHRQEWRQRPLRNPLLCPIEPSSKNVCAMVHWRNQECLRFFPPHSIQQGASARRRWWIILFANRGETGFTIHDLDLWQESGPLNMLYMNMSLEVWGPWLPAGGTSLSSTHRIRFSSGLMMSSTGLSTELWLKHRFSYSFLARSPEAYWWLCVLAFLYKGWPNAVHPDSEKPDFVNGICIYQQFWEIALLAIFREPHLLWRKRRINKIDNLMLRWNIIVHLLTMFVLNPYQTFYVFPTPHPPPMCQPYPSEPVVKTAWGRCIDRVVCEYQPPEPRGPGNPNFWPQKGSEFSQLYLSPHKMRSIQIFKFSQPTWVGVVRKKICSYNMASLGSFWKPLKNLNALFANKYFLHVTRCKSFVFTLLDNSSYCMRFSLEPLFLHLEESCLK